MATKKKAPQPVDVEFQEIMEVQQAPVENKETNDLSLDESKSVPSHFLVNSTINESIKFEYKNPEEVFVSKYANFINEDGLKILVDLRSVKRVEEVPHSEIAELFSPEELEEQPLWNHALLISFYDEEEQDPDEVGYYYGKSFDELQELMTKYERSIKR